MTSHGEVVCSNLLAIRIKDVTGGNQVAVLRLGDNLLGQSGGIVGLSTIGKSFLHVVELQCTGILRNDNGIEGVPLGNLLALVNNFALLVI